MLRDLAAKLGKKVDFVTRGEATELDKGLIERIADPLTHLVRNSFDHGIELPDKRAPPARTKRKLTLSASHQGGYIVIEVTDDGGGLYRDRLLDKAGARPAGTGQHARQRGLAAHLRARFFHRRR